MNMYLTIVVLGAINLCLAQNINSPALDWIQTDGTGAYRYGYATGDEGRHYHVQSASADNTVAGKFGYKDPATGRDLQTTYTAGKRGFRARGPHIARRMDLSQAKGPFSRPNDDGQYHPELDNYFDPTEDRGYDFSYRTSNHIKEEHANSVGDVQGRYSYLDDIGFRHNVHYVAGSKTGFVVTNPVPDTFAQARGGPLYYVGKTGGAKVRGFSAVQKNLNGAYRFAASGPDHKRTEVSDASGNRRGVYTYLDDKGVQHTVEYIAGPKIGYKVINNKKGVNYNPILPFFVDSSTVLPLFPASPGSGSSTVKPGLFPTGSPSSTPGPFSTIAPFDVPFPGGGSGAGAGGSSEGSASGFPSDGSFPSIDGPFPSKPSGTSSGGGGGSHGPPVTLPPAAPGSTVKPPGPSLFKPSTVKPTSLFKPSTENPSGSSGGLDGFDKSGDFPSPLFPSPSPSPFDPAFSKWGYDFDYFNDPSNVNPDWSKPLRGQSKPSTPLPPFHPYPVLFPTPFSDISFGLPDVFREGLNTAESGSALKPPLKGKDDSKKTSDESKSNKPGAGTSDSGSREHQSEEDKDHKIPHQSGHGGKDGSSKHYHKGYKGVEYPSRGTVKFGGVKKNEWHKVKHDDGYFSIPPGVAVRAHVQSLDIVPWNKRYLPPGEALENHEIQEHLEHHKEH
ncbi:hypothetical protein RUM44_013565 [Polyplax serrata]|uniref:Uncharacterized protein n=1 Tax=Polyplax serrata TaxID=468196 RepID=A0ABR1BIN1_POLSC